MTDDNRSILLDQALQLFSARGYDAVAVQEVVDAAGVTKPTLYHYFGSKHGLLEALLQQRLGNFLQAVQEAAEYGSDLTMSLRALARAYFDYAREQPLFYQFLLSAQYAPPSSDSYKAAAIYNERLFHWIMQMFEQALPHMQRRQREYAITFIGMVNTYITLALNGYIDLNDELMYRAVHQFMHGIFS